MPVLETKIVAAEHGRPLDEVFRCATPRRIHKQRIRVITESNSDEAWTVLPSKGRLRPALEAISEERVFAPVEVVVQIVLERDGGHIGIAIP